MSQMDPLAKKKRHWRDNKDSYRRLGLTYEDRLPKEQRERLRVIASMRAWIAALRCGAYPQGRGLMHYYDREMVERWDPYGVACFLFKAKKVRVRKCYTYWCEKRGTYSAFHPPEEIVEWHKVVGIGDLMLAADDPGVTFGDIASVIEEATNTTEERWREEGLI